MTTRMRSVLYCLGAVLLAISVFFLVVVTNGEDVQVYQCSGTYRKDAGVGSSNVDGDAFLRLAMYRWFLFWTWGDAAGNAHFESTFSDIPGHYFGKVSTTATRIDLYDRDYGEMINNRPSDRMRGSLSTLSGSLKIMLPPAYSYDGVCRKK